MMSARITFGAGWLHVVQGVLRAGEDLLIDYDPARLPAGREQWRGAAAWDIELAIVFHPSRGRVTTSVLTEVRTSGVVVDRQPRTVTLAIPLGTTSMELWFRNTSGFTSIREEYDSRFGANFCFGVEPERC